MSSPMKTFLALACLLALSGCGGSSSGGRVAEGGIGGTGISTGVITRFGSVVVNGVEFNTDNAVFSRDEDNSLTQNDFRIGMVVTVRGRIDAGGLTGSADSVSFNSRIEGPVTAAAIGNALEVMGITINVDSSTRFEDVPGNSISGLQLGDVVDISGFTDASGRVHASYIELTGDAEHRATGTVSGLANESFNLGSLRVNAAGLDLNGLSNGSLVEVKGVYNNAGGQFDAARIELDDGDLGTEDADEAELEGIAMGPCDSATPPCEFLLGNVRVRVEAATRFEGGARLADIQAGLRIEAEGSLQGGVLIADEIRFEEDVELESQVLTDDLGADTKSLQLQGLDGITVLVDRQRVELKDELRFTDDWTGRDVKIRGRAQTGNRVAASRVEPGDAGELVLQGEAEAVQFDEIRILGITVNTAGFNDLPNSDFAISDTAVSRAEFYSAAQPGRIIKLEGTLAVNPVWEQVELED